MGHNWGLNLKICQFEFSDTLWTPRFLKPTMVTHLLHLSIQSHGHQVLVCWVNSRCAHAILCKLTKWFLFCQESHSWFSFSKEL